MFNDKLESALQSVHPLQIPSISNLLSCEFPSEINYAILFGGSVLLTCLPSSDIDLYLIGDVDLDVYKLRAYFSSFRAKIGKPMDILYSTESDFIEQSKISGSVESKVWKEGVVIYAKGECNPIR